MSDRKGRERELPVGYQFGDAGVVNTVVIDVTEHEHRFVMLQPEFMIRIHRHDFMVGLYSDEQWNRREGGMHS